MKLLSSHKTAILLTLAALLTELWRGFLDAMFVLPVDFADPTTMNLAALIFTTLFAGWGIALAFSWQGSNKGLIAAFLINLLVLIAVPIGWLVSYCPAACRVEAGIFNLANSLNLIFGILAAVSLALHLIGKIRPKEASLDSGGAKDAA